VRAQARWEAWRSSITSADDPTCVLGKSQTRRFSDGLEQCEVVRRGRDGDMAHRSGEDWKLCLNIDSRAIPSQQNVNGVGMSQIMYAGEPSLGRADSGGPEKKAQSMADGSSRVCPQASGAAHQKRGLGVMRQAMSRLEIPSDFVNRIVG